MTSNKGIMFRTDFIMGNQRGKFQMSQLFFKMMSQVLKHFCYIQSNIGTTIYILACFAFCLQMLGMYYCIQWLIRKQKYDAARLDLIPCMMKTSSRYTRDIRTRTCMSPNLGTNTFNAIKESLLFVNICVYVDAETWQKELILQRYWTFFFREELPNCMRKLLNVDINQIIFIFELPLKFLVIFNHFLPEYSSI